MVNFKTDAKFSDFTVPGEVGFYTDFANVANSAEPTQWAPELSFGITKNEGVREIVEFCAPRVNRPLNAYTAYNYRFYPVKNAIVDEQDASKFERGVGGEFPFAQTTNVLKTSQMKNLGVSITTENRMAENDPNYERLAVQHAAALLEGAIASKVFAALDAIAEEVEWDASADELNYLLASEVETASNRVGKDLNRLLIGRGFWREYQNALGSSDAAINFALFTETPERFGDRHNLNVLVPSARLRDSTGVFPRFANNVAYCFLARTGDDDGMSNLLTFTDGRGFEINTFDHPQKQMKIHTVSTWIDVAAVVPDGILKFALTSSEE